jgi:hypothetical protein
MLRGVARRQENILEARNPPLPRIRRDSKGAQRRHPTALGRVPSSDRNGPANREYHFGRYSPLTDLAVIHNRKAQCRKMRSQTNGPAAAQQVGNDPIQQSPKAVEPSVTKTQVNQNEPSRGLQDTPHFSQRRFNVASREQVQQVSRNHQIEAPVAKRQETGVALAQSRDWQRMPPEQTGGSPQHGRCEVHTHGKAPRVSACQQPQGAAGPHGNLQHSFAISHVREIERQAARFSLRPFFPETVKRGQPRIDVADLRNG